jgi:hypothetical protein
MPKPAREPNHLLDQATGQVIRLHSCAVLELAQLFAGKAVSG